MQALGGAIVGAATWGVHHVDKINELVPKSAVVTAIVTGAWLLPERTHTHLMGKVAV